MAEPVASRGRSADGDRCPAFPRLAPPRPAAAPVPTRTALLSEAFGTLSDADLWRFVRRQRLLREEGQRGAAWLEVSLSPEGERWFSGDHEGRGR